MKNRALVKAMQERGWETGMSAKGHLKFTHPPTRKKIFYPGSASCKRAEKNHWATVKKVEEGRMHAL